VPVMKKTKMARGLMHAIDKTVRLRINPGGQVLGHDVPAENAARIKPEWMDRLLSKTEVTEMDKVVFK
jgi:hypothetical protein